MTFLIEERSKGQDPRPSGVIRTGIKLPTKATRENQRAMELYQRGIAAHEKFDTIEKNIQEACKIKYPLAPNNPAFFYVNRENFRNPAAADEIIEKYGEDRGDGKGRQVYKFPITPCSDIPTKFLSMRFNAYKGLDGKSYHSEYVGDRLMCMTLPDIVADGDDKAKRMRKMPRKPITVRECDPDNCAHFGNRKCKQLIEFKCYIPGTTAGLISFSTSSEYAGKGIFLEFKEIVETLGFIPRLFNGEPVFYIAKELRQTSYVNDNGELVTGMQWTATLIKNIDMAKLVAIQQDRHLGNLMGNLPALAAPSSTSVAMLETPAPGVMIERPGTHPVHVVKPDVNRHTGEIDMTGSAGGGSEPAGESAAGAGREAQATTGTYIPADRKPDPGAERKSAVASQDGAQAAEGSRAVVANLRRELSDCVKKVSQQAGFFDSYVEFAKKRYGEEWGGQVGSLRRASTEFKILGQVVPMGIPMEQFAAYADKRFGESWADTCFNKVFAEVKDAKEAGEDIYAQMVFNVLNPKEVTTA